MGKRRNRNRKGKGKVAQLVDKAVSAVTGHGGNTHATGGGARNTGTYSRQCHKGPVAVFTVGKCTVFAGSRFEVPWRSWALLISCAGEELTPIPPVQMSPRAKAMLPDLEVPEPTPWISLAWPDGAAPRFTKATWQQLADAIKNIDGDVGICCVGGHGRTGTAVAILAALCGVVPEDECPVHWLRKRYCLEAVETDGQCSYVAHITGREVYAAGSFFSYADQFPTYTRHTPAAPSPAGAANASNPVVMGPKKEATATTAESVVTVITGDASTAQATLPLRQGPVAAQAGGKYGTPVTNAAGDIIGYDYTDLEDDEDDDRDTPWSKWGMAM